MTNERSDELRRKHGHWSPHRNHHPTGSIADAGLDVLECLDALDAMTAERDRLQSSLEARVVVVPPPGDRVGWVRVDRWKNEGGRAVWVNLDEVLHAGRLSAIPADRALGDGMVAVDREEWAELRGIESCVRAVMAYDGLVGTEERNRLKRLDTLRASQGGSDHGNG